MSDKPLKKGWIRIEKFYQGGSTVYTIYVTQEIIRMYGTGTVKNFLSIVDSITPGRKACGARLYIRYLRGPAKGAKHLAIRKVKRLVIV